MRGKKLNFFLSSDDGDVFHSNSTVGVMRCNIFTSCSSVSHLSQKRAILKNSESVRISDRWEEAFQIRFEYGQGFLIFILFIVRFLFFVLFLPALLVFLFYPNSFFIFYRTQPHIELKAPLKRCKFFFYISSSTLPRCCWRREEFFHHWRTEIAKSFRKKISHKVKNIIVMIIKEEKQWNWAYHFYFVWNSK